MKRQKDRHVFALLKFKRPQDQMSRGPRVPLLDDTPSRIRRLIDRYQELVGRDPEAAELLLSWLEAYLTVVEARLESTGK
jgi:hypothetical protein